MDQPSLATVPFMWDTGKVLALIQAICNDVNPFLADYGCHLVDQSARVSHEAGKLIYAISVEPGSV